MYGYLLWWWKKYERLFGKCISNNQYTVNEVAFNVPIIQHTCVKEFIPCSDLSPDELFFQYIINKHHAAVTTLMLTTSVTHCMLWSCDLSQKLYHFAPYISCWEEVKTVASSGKTYLILSHSSVAFVLKSHQ